MNNVQPQCRIVAALITAFLMIPAMSASAQPTQNRPTSDRSSGDNGDKQTLIATAFDEPLYLEQLTLAEAEVKRKELSHTEIEIWLRSVQGARTYDNIWAAVSRRYVEREKLDVTQDEMDAIVKSVEQRMKSEPEQPAGTTPTPAEWKGISVAWARASLHDWKVCKSLYEKYGGRVGTGSLGSWTALDGQYALLREHLKAGDIKFHHAKIENAFWKYAQREHFADTYPNGDRLKYLLSTPPFSWSDKSGATAAHSGTIVSHIDLYGAGTGSRTELSSSGQMVTGFDYGNPAKPDWKGSIKWQLLRREGKSDVYQIEWDYKPKAGVSHNNVEELSFDGVMPAKLVINEQWVISIEPNRRERIGSALGQDIYRDQIKSTPPTYNELVQLFMAPALNKFREQHAPKFDMTDDEIRAASEWLTAQVKAQDNKQAVPDAGLVNFLFGGRKFEQYLYDNYGGGRIIHQQLGPEALDARRRFLLELEKAGKFQIIDPELRKLAYDYWERPNHPGGFHTDRRLLDFPWTATYQEMIRENEGPPLVEGK